MLSCEGYVCKGVYNIVNQNIVITELPPKVWIDPYIESLQKSNIDYVSEIINHCTKQDVHIVIKTKTGVDLEKKDIGRPTSLQFGAKLFIILVVIQCSCASALPVMISSSLSSNVSLPVASISSSGTFRSATSYEVFQ